MKTILAIDQSTSATKAVLFDTAGKIIDQSVREHRQIYPQPGWVEHDAEEIWQNVLAVIREIASRNRSEIESAVALCIANQRETIVVFERTTGRPLHNAIVWQCRRGDDICRQLRESGYEQTVREKTGLKLDTYFSASKLKWLIEARPEIRDKLNSDDALIGTIDAYLVYRLTGGAVFATDHTNASRTLLFNIEQLRWDNSLCEMFTVPPKSLAEVRESFSQFGQSNAEGALPKPLPICGVMGDSQASLFAQRCHRPGMVKATFGSGTSVLLNVGQQLSLSPGERAGVRGNEVPSAAKLANVTGPTKALQSNFPLTQTPNSSTPSPCPLPEGEGSGRQSVVALAWVHQGQPVYALEGIINYSSATISWLKNQLELIRDASETTALANSVSDNGGVYLVPAFAGLSAPYWNEAARAAIVGMTAFTRKEHVVRAALEAIAYQIRDVLVMMQSDGGVQLQKLFADGGPTRNEFLMQFTADMIGLELVVAEVPESSALGAAMAGLLGLGVVNSLADFEAWPHETKHYVPRSDRAEIDRLYAGWQAAVKRVL